MIVSKAHPRPLALKRELLARLSRAEGQIRGLKTMVDREGYCISVLQQLTAVRRALDKFALMLVRDHLATCVAEALKDRRPREHRGKIDELIVALDRFLA